MTGFAYKASDRNAQRIGIDEALSLEAPLIWVHLTTTSDAARHWLSETAGLDDYVVDALTATESRPRCDRIGNGAFINLRGRVDDDMTASDPLASVRIWATRGRVISVARKPLVAIDAVVQTVEDQEILDPGDLIAEFAAAITEDLDPYVADLGDTLDDCEASLTTEAIFSLRRNVSHIRIEAIGYRRFLNPQRAALEKLGTLEVDWLQDDDRLHLAAAADRAARMAEELESIRERSALMHEQLTDLRAEQIDSRALIISIVAMVFLPLTFITGLLGMNVKGIPYADEPWAFDAVMGVCALMAAVITIFFVRRHWFR